MPIDRYYVNAGDTLQQIARRELGNADQWWVLARFNQLDHPFIDTSGTLYPGKHVLGIGGVILIVKNADDPAAKRAAIQDSPDQYTLLFGSDLELSEAGDLQADPARGDWQLSVGLPNLIGAVRRRLKTRSGLYPYHPEYGSDLEPHIGQASDAVAATGVRLEVIQSVLNEPRIRAVRKVVIQADAEHVDINIVCDIIGSDNAAPLNIVLQR